MNTQLFVAAWITGFLLGLKIIRALRDHIRAKDIIKLIEAEKGKREAETRAAELKKIEAEVEKLSAEVKLELAKKIAAMSEDQLAAYNRTLTAASMPPRYYPVYIPTIPTYPVYDPISRLQTQWLPGRW